RWHRVAPRLAGISWTGRSRRERTPGTVAGCRPRVSDTLAACRWRASLMDSGPVPHFPPRPSPVPGLFDVERFAGVSGQVHAAAFERHRAKGLAHRRQVFLHGPLEDGHDVFDGLDRGELLAAFRR